MTWDVHRLIASHPGEQHHSSLCDFSVLRNVSGALWQCNHLVLIVFSHQLRIIANATRQEVAAVGSKVTTLEVFGGLKVFASFAGCS